MTRAEAFKEICSKYPYADRVGKLTVDELNETARILLENDHLGHLEFEYKMNRLFIGKPGKNAVTMWELLVCTNSRVYIKPKGDRPCRYKGERS